MLIFATCPLAYSSVCSRAMFMYPSRQASTWTDDTVSSKEKLHMSGPFWSSNVCISWSGSSWDNIQFIPLCSPLQSSASQPLGAQWSAFTLVSLFKTLRLKTQISVSTCLRKSLGFCLLAPWTVTAPDILLNQYRDSEIDQCKLNWCSQKWVE